MSTHPPAYPQIHACSWMEDLNFDALSDVQRAALLVNLMTLALWILAAAVFNWRDSWLGKTFDEERGLPYGNLPLILRGFPSLQVKLKAHNMAAAVAAGALAGFTVSNFALSTFVLCYGVAYGGYKCALASIRLSLRFAAHRLASAALRKGLCCLCPRQRTRAKPLSNGALCYLSGLLRHQDAAGADHQPDARHPKARLHGPVRSQAVPAARSPPVLPSPPAAGGARRHRDLKRCFFFFVLLPAVVPQGGAGQLE